MDYPPALWANSVHVHVHVAGVVQCEIWLLKKARGGHVQLSTPGTAPTWVV